MLDIEGYDIAIWEECSEEEQNALHQAWDDMSAAIKQVEEAFHRRYPDLQIVCESNTVLLKKGVTE